MAWDAATLTRLQQARWRQPSSERRWLSVGLLLSFVLHGLFVLAVYDQMRAANAPDSDNAGARDVLQVRFFTDSPTPAVKPSPLPALPSLPQPTAQRVVKRVPVVKGAMTVQLAAPAPASSVHLYDKDGLPILPAAATGTAVEPGYVQRLPQGDTQIMQHKSSIPYKATRFDDMWNRNTDPIDSALQKLVDKATIKKTIRLPKGVRIHCAITIIPPFGGCGGDPPAAPSAKDGDERLSMAPAKPIAEGIAVPKPPSVAACIAMYRAGKPLAYGCPIDTPNRSVDAELRQHAGSAKRAASATDRP